MDARKRHKAKVGGLATEIPLVVLINEGCASAFGDRCRRSTGSGARLPGRVKTFGKGSVQTVSQLVNDQGAVRVTIARWLTPNRRQISKIGLNPISRMTHRAGHGRWERCAAQRAIEVLLKGLTPPPTPVQLCRRHHFKSPIMAVSIDMVIKRKEGIRMFLNTRYIIYMLPAFILMMMVQWYVQSAYSRWSQVPTRSQMTGADAAQRLINTRAGCTTSGLKVWRET